MHRSFPRNARGGLIGRVAAGRLRSGLANNQAGMDNVLQFAARHTCDPITVAKKATEGNRGKLATGSRYEAD